MTEKCRYMKNDNHSGDMPVASQCALRVEGLTKCYGRKTAVNSISLTIEKGDFFGFLGPNGAGKSTTISMLTGMLKPDCGNARIHGLSIPDTGAEGIEARRLIGVMPDNLALFRFLKGHEHLKILGQLHGVEENEVEKRIEELSKILDMKEALETITHLCSHGMKKKLSLASALIHNPKVLFLDEPFEGIDASTSRSIKELLDHINKRGVTIFLTSHILQIVERLCRSFAIIRNGEIIYKGCMGETTKEGLEEAYMKLAGIEGKPPMPEWLGHEKG